MIAGWNPSIIFYNCWTFHWIVSRRHLLSWIISTRHLKRWRIRNSGSTSGWGSRWGKEKAAEIKRGWRTPLTTPSAPFLALFQPCWHPSTLTHSHFETHFHTILNKQDMFYIFLPLLYNRTSALFLIVLSLFNVGDNKKTISTLAKMFTCISLASLDENTVKKNEHELNGHL